MRSIYIAQTICRKCVLFTSTLQTGAHNHSHQSHIFMQAVDIIWLHTRNGWGVRQLHLEGPSFSCSSRSASWASYPSLSHPHATLKHRSSRQIKPAKLPHPFGHAAWQKSCTASIHQPGSRRPQSVSIVVQKVDFWSLERSSHFTSPHDIAWFAWLKLRVRA